MTDTLVYSSHEGSRAPVSLPVRVGAEFVGSYLVITVILIFWALVPPASSSYPASLIMASGLLAAFAYGAVAFLFGRVSGGQINPAVTFAAALTARISWLDAISYIIAQLVGGIAAAATVVYMLPVSTNTSFPFKTFLAYMTNLYDQGNNQYLLAPSLYSSLNMNFGMNWTIILEVLAVIAIVGVYLATSTKNGLSSRGYPLAMAMAYGSATMLTYPFDHAGLNPARSTGIAIFTQMKGLTNPSALKQLWVFWVTALLASAIVALVTIIYSSVHANDDAIYREIQLEESTRNPYGLSPDENGDSEQKHEETPSSYSDHEEQGNQKAYKPAVIVESIDEDSSENSFEEK